MATRTQVYKKLGAEKVQAIQVDCRKAVIDDDASVGGDLAVTGNAAVTGTLAVTSTSALTGAVTITGALTANGNVTLGDGADTITINGTALGATAAEINNTADVSARAVAAGSTLSVTAALHDGKLINLNTASGSVCTLPVATGSGAKFRFSVTVVPTSNSHIIKVADASGLLRGVLHESDTNNTYALATYPTLVASDTITLPSGDNLVAGAWVEVQDIAANLYSVIGYYARDTAGTIFSAAV